MDTRLRFVATMLLASPTAIGCQASADAGAGTACAKGEVGGAGRPCFDLQQRTLTGCVLDDEELACWGNDALIGYGPDGGTLLSPAPAPGGLTFENIAVSDVNVCGLHNGVAYCFGANDPGQSSCSAVPCAMFPERAFSSLTVGRLQTCGIDQSGDVFCWGSNDYGALGIADTTVTSNAVPGPFVAVGNAQDNTCALSSGGALTCWGLGYCGVLGSPTTGVCDTNDYTSYPPTLVGGDHIFTSFDVEAFNVCALDTDGVGWCWGDDTAGQLTGSLRFSDVPRRFEVPEGVVLQQIRGSATICGVSTAGDVYCAGCNEWGALGIGTQDQKPHPEVTKVTGLPPVVALRGGDGYEFCALTSAAQRYCWGQAVFGNGLSSRVYLRPTLIE